MSAYTPLTGAACGCRRGQERDNCPRCEGTGKGIDFRAIHAAREQDQYLIRGRKVGAIGVMQDIMVLYAKDKDHAFQRAMRLYEEGWEHLQPFKIAPNYRPGLKRA